MPMTEGELEVLLAEQQHKVESLLGKLKSCDDYLSLEACDSIEKVSKVCKLLWEDPNYQKISMKLVDFMLQHGLAQLLVKIAKSAGKVGADFRWFANLIVAHLSSRMTRLTGLVDGKAISLKFKVELIKSGMVGSLIKELDTYDPKTKDPKQRLLITCTLIDLHNLRLAPNVIPIIRATKAIKVLMKFAKADNVMTTIDSLMLLSRIVNEKESEHIAASRECIMALLDVIDKGAKSPERFYRTVLNIDGKKRGFRKTLNAGLQTLSELANNDANKEAFVQNGGLSILTTILRPEYKGDQMHAVEALWKLSFLESNVDVMLTHLTYTDQTALQVLKEMKSSTSPRIVNASQGVLYQLGLLDIHAEPPVEEPRKPTAPPSARPLPRSPPPSYKETIDAPHIMISYKWDQQDRAIKVRDELRKREGNMIVAMANAVDKAEAVLVCVSGAYKTSTNCQHEANYAYKQEKPIIPLMVEDGYQPDGWLAFIIAMKKYIRAYSDAVLEKDMPDLIRELGNKGRAV